VIVTARGVLVLIGLALFLAIGLEPAVSIVARRWSPRWVAVLTVLVAGLAVVSGFLALPAPRPHLTTQPTPASVADSGPDAVLSLFSSPALMSLGGFSAVAGSGS